MPPRARRSRRLPTTISEAQFLTLLEHVSATSPSGLRNAAVLLVMYDAGLRVGEFHPGADVGVECAGRAVRAAAQLLVSQLGKPALDEVQPRLTGRGEVQHEARVRGQPFCGSLTSCACCCC